MKKILAVTAMLAAIVSISGAEVMKWTAWDDLGADLAGITGTGAEIGWGVQLYQADAPRTAATDAGWYNQLRLNADGSDVSGVDSLIAGAFTPVIDDGGWFIIDSTVNTGDGFIGEYYSVLFNSDAIDTATKFVVLDSSTFFLKNGDGTIGPAPTYNTFKTYESDVAWQVIPEPATFGLMGIAGLGMFLARKKSRR